MSDNKAVFTREALLAIKPPEKTIEPPGYPGLLEIRGLNSAEQSKVFASQFDVKFVGGQTEAKGKLEGANQLICSLGVTNPKLNAQEWGYLPNDLVQFAADEIRELSGMNVTVEEAEKNSEGALISS